MNEVRVGRYEPDGRVLRDFIADVERGNPITGINGPVGSGKTMALVDGWMRRSRQAPVHPKWGDRRYKNMVVRDTYPNMQKTIIPSYADYIGMTFGKPLSEIGEFTGGNNSPARHVYSYQLLLNGERRTIHVETEFRAIGNLTVEAAMRGWQGQDVVANEWDLLPPEFIDFAIGRVGRDPGIVDGSWDGIIFGDFNAPEFGNWILDYFWGQSVSGRRIHIQPGGMEPDSENLKHLPGGRKYYERQLEQMVDKSRADRLVHNKPGTSQDGERVYPEFRGDLHLKGNGIAPIDAPLILGADQGLNPAIVISQIDSFGQRRVLHELCGKNVMVDAFANDLNRLLAEPRFDGLEVGQAWGDPAGAARAAQQTDEERTWLREMSRITGVPFRPARANGLEVRLTGVKRELTRNTASGPGLVVSQPHCPILSVGFMSGYRFRQIAMAGHQKRMADTPEKNTFSEPHDALQYAVMGNSGGVQRDERDRRRQVGRKGRSTRPAGGFDPMSV